MSNSPLALRGGRPAIQASRHVRWPVLGDSDKASVMGVLERGILSGPFAPEVRGLEKEFATFAGSRYAVASNSGTAALHLALGAVGVRPGDEVVTSAFSFVATAMAVLQQSAIPVFVDIEPVTLGLNPQLLEKAITPRTKAILPVHIHGVPCDLDPILEIAKRKGIPVIEDAAQSHGALYKGKPVGSLGAVGCFSLQSSKNLACGEGGLLTTQDDEIFQRAWSMRMFGENVRAEDEAGYRLDRALDGNRAYDSVGIGWMYRTTEMSAALARSQLRHLPKLNANALRNAHLLSERLAKLPGVTPPQIPADRVPAFHKYRVRIDARSMGIDAPATRVRDAVLRALQAEGVDAVLWQTQPVPGQTLFQNQEGLGRRSPNRPGHPWDLGEPVSYDLQQYPETVKLLESSICLFSHTYPIAPQQGELVEAYGEAFAKVWGHLDEVLAHEAPTGSAR